MSDAKWFLPNDQTLRAEGPFSTDEILQKLADQTLDFQDFIWSHDLAEKRWYRLYEINVFNTRMRPKPITFLPQNLSRGQKVIKPDTEIFANRAGHYGIENMYRRFPRAPIEVEAIVHDENDILFCQTVDISERGISVQSEKFIFQKGAEVSVTMRSEEKIGTFTCRAVIIHIFEREHTSGAQMGLYFLSLNPNVRRRIANYVIDQLELRSIDKSGSEKKVL